MSDREPRGRFAQLLREQGHIPSADPDIAEVYKLLDEHYEQVVSDLDAAAAAAADRITNDLMRWQRRAFPEWAVESTELIGWINPEILVRESAIFPTHHTQESMALYAAETIDDFDTHETTSLDLHVSLHSHWNGHIAEITTNGRHRAAIYRASKIPLVQCYITIPRNGLRRFIPETWTDREDRLMGWLVAQDLVTRFTHPADMTGSSWGGSTYSVEHGSPIPWLLGYRCADPVNELPKRISALEHDFGPIRDKRIDPLRTPRGVQDLCGPRPGSLRGFAQSLGISTPPPVITPMQEPAEPIGLPGQRVYEMPPNVLSALLEGLPANTAALMGTHPDQFVAHPGDPFGRVLAWLAVNDMMIYAVEQVQELYALLREKGTRVSWRELVSGIGLSLPARGISSDQINDLLGELLASSPEARVASQRPEPDGERERRRLLRDERAGLT